MAYPKLPDEAQRELDNMAAKYSICMNAQQYDSALNIIEDLYNRMLKWQKDYGQRFHKGYPLHQIGYTLLLQNNDKAPKYFILAYIEDLLSVDRLEEADTLPAGQTLLNKLSPNELMPLKQIVAELRQKGKIPWQPEEIVKELPRHRDLEAKAMVVESEAPLRPFTKFDSEWEMRVFVGGSIGLRFIIDKIADLVRDSGYDPIVCHQFETPEEMEADIRRKCLALLHCCRYAIFDIAEHKGQLVEIDRAPEYGVSALVVWPNTKEKEVTEMLKSLLNRQQIKSNSYRKFPEDVKAIIREFLPQKSFGGSS